jgi:hypothetical protein
LYYIDIVCVDAYFVKNADKSVTHRGAAQTEQFFQQFELKGIF